MVDVQKQIDYWQTSSDEDFAAAESLLEEGHLRHCLFFAHLAIEKILKAYITKRTKDIPPRIQNLIRLAEKADLSLNTEQATFLRSFDVYQLEGRYPDSTQILLDSKAAQEKLTKAGDIIKWLKAQL
jgi:HEPN domain-containing protein